MRGAWRSALLVAVLAASVALALAKLSRRKLKRREPPTGGEDLASFHEGAKLTSSYMDLGQHFDGPAAAKDLGIPEMFSRIADKWPGARYASSDPPVLLIEDFITPREARHIIKIGTPGLTQSSGTGALQPDGSFKRTYSDYRTSQNSWLMNGLEHDPQVKEIDRRIANLTGLFPGNSEHYQVLRYTGADGNYYKLHSDFIPGHLKMPMGPRIFTMFIYLTGVPEGKGGYTYFPDVDPPGNKPGCNGRGSNFDKVANKDESEVPCGLLVRPKAYSAIIWPDTDLDDLSRQHQSTEHMALPIFDCDDCVKWAANVWIHLHDFKASHLQGKGG